MLQPGNYNFQKEDSDEMLYIAVMVGALSYNPVSECMAGLLINLNPHKNVYL